MSEVLDRAFAGHVEPFVSSMIPIGKNWLSAVKDELGLSHEILPVFTHRSVDRPWLNIETGYGIMTGRPVTPVLFGGFKADELPVIYQLQQAVDEHLDASILKLFTSISGRLKEKIPRARASISAKQFLAKWRSKVSVAASRSLGIKVV